MTKTRLTALLLTLLFFLFRTQQTNAQLGFTIVYGETQSAIFEEEEFTHRWIFFGDTGDILTIRAYRIAGQFTPRLRLLDAAGTVIASSVGSGFNDYDELVYSAGLPISEFGDTEIPYQIEVSGIDVRSSQRDNPAEYSLSLINSGSRKNNINEGLTPLPEIGVDTIPNLRVGSPTNLSLGYVAYGANPQLTRSDTANVPIRFLLRSGRWQLAINENNATSRGINAVSFLDTGIALTLLNDRVTSPATFLSDRNFMVAYENTRREYTFTFEDGLTVITDFFQITDIQVVDGFVLARTSLNGQVKRMLFTGALVDIRRLGGGEGSEEGINQIRLHNNQSIVTDLQGFESLAYVDGQLRVLYSADARLLTSLVRLDIRQNNTNRNLNEIIVLAPQSNSSGNTRPINFNIDWRRMGDVRIDQNQLVINPLDERTLTESISTLSSVLIEDGGVQILRTNGSYRTSFPDRTDIETPANLPDDSNVLPHQAGFRARNANNLGREIIPYCPCLEDFLNAKPVNPANGNFFYEVTDFYIPSHTLELNLTRYYNSQDTGLTPAYMLSADYDTGKMGIGWRHSYQYELDISGAPAGQVRLIMPDGTQHLFFAGTNNEWQSRTLISWTLTRASLLGRWQASSSNGISYYFDRSGRLLRISESPQRSITISPMPINYEASHGGLFITEPYGRRLELYNGASGNIERARDTSARQILYTYENNHLVSAEYITPSQTASYEYNATGLLIRFNDMRSPYTQVGSLEYDNSRRVVQYVENPEGLLLRRDYRYLYESNANGRVTSRTIRVSGRERRETWTYNALFQLTRYSTPRQGYDYEFAYDSNTGLLASYRVPTLVRYQVQWDAKGNLIRFEDPFFTGAQSYNLNYEQRGTRTLLNRMTYPNGGEDTFVWSAGNDPRLLAHQQLVSVGAERVIRETRYEYDSWGRLVMEVTASNIATLYQYDTFGYVETIWEGIVLAQGETRSSITSSNRARRVLQFDYDLIGQVRSVTDGRGQTYTLNWDSSIEQLRQVNGTDGVSIAYNYDERGRVTLVNDRGQETQYTYNGLDLITGVIDAAGIVLTFDYDEAGNLLSVVDDLQRNTRYRYDELNNPIEITSPSGIVTRFETLVEQDFTVHRETDPTGRRITRRYDVLGRLRRYTLEAGSFTQEFRITYNEIGLPLSIEEPTSAYSLDLEYDLIGQVRAISVEGSRTSFNYDARGQLTRVTSPAGRVTNYTYDPLGNISRVTLPDNSQLRYEYDENSNLLSSTDTGNLVTTYVYDALNQLITVENPAGFVESYDYDIRGNLSTIVDPREISRSFEYDALNRLVSATDGRGQKTSYQYDALGRLFNIQQPGVRSTRLTYDAEDNIIAVTERPREQRTLYSYDVLGRISSITDPLGHTTSYSYNSLGRITRTIDALGNEERYTWQGGVQSLAGFNDAGGRSYAFNSDSLGRITTVRDLVTEQNVAINTQYNYDADGYIQGIQIGTDQARGSGINDIFYQYQYAPNGNITRYIDPNGGEWALTYDGSQRINQVTNPLGQITSYIRDRSGRIVRQIKNVGTPQESTESFEYDAAGNIIRYIAPNGVINSYRYDQNSQLLQATIAEGTPLESRYIFDYNALGQLIRTIDPNGIEVRYFYSLDQLTRVERDLGEESLAISYNYDDAGNLRNVTYPGRNDNTDAFISLNMTYDALNRRVRYVNGEDNVWSYTYNPAGNVAQISDPLGSVIRYVYDNYKRVTQINYPTGAGTVDLGYDTAGNLRTVSLPANSNGTKQTTTYLRDVAGNITEMQIGNNITRYAYDVMGNLTRRTAPDGTVTNYQYDATGRLTSTRYPNSTINYSYDAVGNLLSAGDLRYEYDVLGRVSRASGAGYNLRYTYDALGNVQIRNAGLLGVTSYTYDELYRPVELDLNGQKVSLVYDEMNQVRQILRGNGVRSILNYDAAGRPINILHFGASNERLDGFSYQYDAVGNLIRTSRIIDGTQIIYSYDIAHRLIDERWLNEIGETVYAVSFRYDEVGNRIEETRNGVRTLFRYNELNQLIEEVRNFNPQNDSFALFPLAFGLVFVSSFALRRRRQRWIALFPVLLFAVGAVYAQTSPSPNVRYTHDGNGNLTQIRYLDTNRQINFSYDAENRLTAVRGTDEFGTALDAEYRYDAKSRLIYWRNIAETYNLFYDGDNLIGMSDAEGNVFEQYLSLGNERLLTLRGDAAFWHLNDQIGSTRRFVDAAGSLIDQPSRIYDFGGFGTRIYPYNQRTAPIASEVDVPSSFFAGHLYDPASKLYLIGLRAYKSEIGRFFQVDPIQQDPIATLYTYARNRPFVFTDRDGMTVQPFIRPTSAVNFSQNLEPESLIPRPDIPEMPLAQATYRAQSDETYRALELLDALYHGTNESLVTLAPSLDNLYLFESNPMPARVQTQRAESLHALMSIYHVGDGWLPDPRTNPTMPVDAFRVLHEVEGLLSQAYIDPLIWCGVNRPVQTQILPSVAMPQGLSQDWQTERDLLQQLQPVQVMSALLPETSQLTQFNNLNLAPDLPQPQVSEPLVSIEPPILANLDDLRQASFRIRNRIWKPEEGTCEDCLAPLTFSR